MADMIKVTNSAKYCIKVGGIAVKGGAEAEVDASELDAMSSKGAGKAANEMASMLKKAAGRKPKDDTPAIKSVCISKGNWNVLGLDGEVVADGEGLVKADADALRDLLIAEAAKVGGE